ncbi:ATP-binding protein [Streptomyces tauricus]|nr:ATP-binding protein [Streptomyces tauricus]
MLPDNASIQERVVLDSDGPVAAEARHRAAGFLVRALAEHGLPVSARTMDVTRLVVSELVTNAYKYAPGPVVMQLRVAGDLVEVAVWDSAPVLPVPRAADAGRVGQHGLEIVKALAHSFEVRQEPGGKRVTARIALLDDPHGDVSGPRPR